MTLLDFLMVGRQIALAAVGYSDKEILASEKLSVFQEVMNGVYFGRRPEAFAWGGALGRSTQMVREPLSCRPRSG